MNVETVPIESVRPDAENARVHTSRNLETIRTSLERFGQQKPIVVDADGVILAGNGTWEAAVRLGWSEIAVVRSALSGAEARTYAIVDNRSSDQSSFDDRVLLSQLDAIREHEDSLVRIAGFDDAELRALRAAVAEPTPPESFPDVTDPLTNHECPRCSYVWSGDCRP